VISTLWVEKRKPYWNRLEQLLEQGRRRGLKSLGRADLQELGLLYRQIAADLAAVQEDRSSLQYVRYLNQLLARTHNTIYSGRKGSRKEILGFFTRTYPQVFRRNLLFVVAATAVFLLGSVVGVLLTLQDPDFELKVLGPRMVETIEKREMWTHSIVSIKPIASSGIMTNNMSVAFTTFALGITAGVGTLYMMFFNGLLMGVIGAACAMAGMSRSLWSFVAPHGALELPAIFIAGGAGLRIAFGLLFPGNLPRRQALARAGAEGAALVVGTIPMLVVAGIIEGFVSPTEVAVPLKFAMGAALLILLIVYLWKESNPPQRHRNTE
jgi:uncharacterized membrane protein SpoIIM required for sporulation